MDFLKFLKELSFYPNRKHLDGVLRCVEGIGEDGDFRVVRIFLIVVDSIRRCAPTSPPRQLHLTLLAVTIYTAYCKVTKFVVLTTRRCKLTNALCGLRRLFEP